MYQWHFGRPKISQFYRLFSCSESLFSSTKLFHHFPFFWGWSEMVGAKNGKPSNENLSVFSFFSLFPFSFCLFTKKIFDINIHNKHQHQPTNRQLNRNKIEKVYVLLCFIYSFRVILLRFLSLFDSNFHSLLVFLPWKSFINWERLQ